MFSYAVPVLLCINKILSNFLEKMSDISNNRWNITMFHYRSNGASVANVLCGLNVLPKDYILFSDFIQLFVPANVL